MVLWHDGRLTYGSNWKGEIHGAIENAVVALLLISPHFLASGFIRTDEVRLLREGLERGRLKVIPIVIRECAWESVDWLASLQVCRAGGRPLASASDGEVEQAWKDLVMQLDADLDAAPPAVQAPPAKRTNISAPLTTFIGREREREALKKLFESRNERLVTLNGGPGLGKTRLARQLGRELLDLYPGGCWFVSLAEARTLTGIAHAIAQAFEVSVASGQISDQDAIVELLKPREPLLLILDNFEQIVRFADESVGYWLERLPDVTFFVTSRETLRIAGEHQYRLDSLAVPPGDWEPADLSVVLRYDSARLFVDRAQTAAPQDALDDDAAAVARICAQLDGIPLALELAAARFGVLTAAQIADRLQENFSLLRSTQRGITGRHQTLYAAIDWSFNLLEEWEQHAFLQLSVFRGGFFLDAAERTVDLDAFPDAPPVLDVVQSLFDKNLINQVQTDYGRRFDMLVSIHDYGRQRWRSQATEAEQESLRRRWADYYIPYVKAWNAKVHTAEGVKALDLLAMEIENIFEIQDWFLAHGEPAVAAEAILAFSATMAVRGPAHLRVPRLRKSLAAPGADQVELRVRLMTGLSAAHWSLGEWDEATELADQAVQHSAGLRTHAAAAALRQQARIRTDRGYLRRALISLSRAKDVYAELTGTSGTAMINGDLAGVYDRLGDFPRSIALVDEAVESARSLGDEAQLAVVLNRKGLVLWHHGHPEEALRTIEEAERINRILGARAWIGAHLTNEGLALVDLDEIERAMKQFESAESIHHELGTQAWAAVNIGGLGRALMMRGQPGDLESALQLFQRAGEISGRVYYPESISFHAGDMGRCLFLLGRFEEARRAVREAISLERVVGASKDLRHFGNLVTLARITQRLALHEECAEAVLRAREMLADGLSLDAARRVRRVREDVEALEQFGDDLSAVERRVVTLLKKHGRRPPGADELSEISRAVAQSFSETSYEYPWTGLEDELAAQGASSFDLFGYGSLVDRNSAKKTLSGTPVPALAFGVVRLCNYDMPDVVREHYYPGLRADDPERAALNVQVTGFLTDVANGVVLDVREIDALREREVGYDLEPIVCTGWDAEGIGRPRKTFVLSAPNRLWKGRLLANPSLRPHPPYLEKCRAGAESFSPSFLGFWRDTTFLADGETPS